MPGRDGSGQLFPEEVIPERDLAYIAGLFDGEGSVVIDRSHSNSYRLKVAFTMTNQEGIAHCAQTFGGRVFPSPPPRRRWSPRYQWHIHGDKAYRFLKAIRPFTRVKSPEIDIALAFFEAYRTVRWQRVTPARIEAGEKARRALAACHPRSAKLNRQHRRKGGSAPTLFNPTAQPALL